jgi:hypothetical protein
MTWWALCALEKLRIAKDIKVAKLIPNPDNNEKDAPAFIGKIITQPA